MPLHRKLAWLCIFACYSQRGFSWERPWLLARLNALGLCMLIVINDWSNITDYHYFLFFFNNKQLLEAKSALVKIMAHYETYTTDVHVLLHSAGWEPKFFGTRPNWAVSYIVLYKITLAQACFPLTQLNFHQVTQTLCEKKWLQDNAGVRYTPVYIGHLQSFFFSHKVIVTWWKFSWAMENRPGQVEFYIGLYKRLPSSGDCQKILV